MNSVNLLKPRSYIAQAVRSLRGNIGSILKMSLVLCIIGSLFAKLVQITPFILVLKVLSQINSGLLLILAYTFGFLVYIFFSLIKARIYADINIMEQLHTH